MVASPRSGFGGAGVARRVGAQASDIGACDCDKSLTHGFVEKQLGKITELMLTVPLGCPAWQADSLEPLILAISMP